MAKTPVVIDEDAATVDATNADTVLKKPDLFAAVVERTNLKKRDVKPAVEAALAIIGEALARGEDVVLPPLGKVRVVKSKEVGGGVDVITLKLRTPKTGVSAAPAGDDDND